MTTALIAAQKKTKKPGSTKTYSTLVCYISNTNNFSTHLYGPFNQKSDAAIRGLSLIRNGGKEDHVDPVGKIQVIKPRNWVDGADSVLVLYQLVAKEPVWLWGGARGVWTHGCNYIRVVTTPTDFNLWTQFIGDTAFMLGSDETDPFEYDVESLRERRQNESLLEASAKAYDPTS